MDGEHVQDLIYDWLNEHYPDGPDWQNPDFDCFAGAPIEIKMVSAFDALEYNIGNGGWSQVLWNCFGCWRELLNVAAEGYALIDEAFATFTSRSYGKPGHEWQRLFWTGSGIYDKRIAWLATNESRVRKTVGARAA